METNLNLILDPWIPVQRRSGQIETIAPFEITDQMDSNPVIKLCAPRPDFNGALIQFLIGLFQTAMAPENEKEWRGRFSAPPKPQELKKQLAPLAHAFNLLGEGPRFMQDMGLKKEGRGKDATRIALLLIDFPQENAINLNKDFFQKSDTVDKLCFSCSACALLSAQLNAPSGGPGYLTSVRGGGPMTITVITDSMTERFLWKDIWLNILTQKRGTPEVQDVFAWLKPLPDSIQEAAPADLHPLAVYWSCSKRIWLGQGGAGKCGVCGLSGESIATYVKKNKGISYNDQWRHPLTPYYKKKDKGNEFFLPYHPQSGGIVYSHWPAIVFGNNGIPARNVATYLEERKGELPMVLLASGYNMDNAKAVSWYESVMPFFTVDDALAPIFEEGALVLLESAKQIAGHLKEALKRAWKKRPADLKGDISFITDSYYSRTQSQYFDRLGILLDQKDHLASIRAGWIALLNKTALNLFDEYACNSQLEFEAMARIASARRSLIKELYSKKNQEPSHV